MTERTGQPREHTVNWSLETIVVPVTDVDRAKDFYAHQTGFTVDVDFSTGEDFRVVQLTPPGSACSISLMKEPDRAGKVSGLHLCVPDIEQARAELLKRGAPVGDYFHFTEGAQQSGMDPARASYATFLGFSDPDGNGWLVQEKH